MITSQNHGFAVDEATLPANVRVTHRSLFDGSNQGIALTDAPAFCSRAIRKRAPGRTTSATCSTASWRSMQRGALTCQSAPTSRPS